MPYQQRQAPNSEDFDRVVNLLDFGQFSLPRPAQSASTKDFRVHLKAELERYVSYYITQVKPHTDDVALYTDDAQSPLTDKITRLTVGIIEAVDYYYKGHLLQADEAFRGALNDVMFEKLNSVESIPFNRSFYRARSGNSSRFTKRDLFHHAFENRGLVGTNRYSIPGLPALYLGDSTYVCWEELNQPSFHTLCFSRFETTETLRVIKIQRLSDYLIQLRTVVSNFHDRYTYLTRYLALFPLSIACSIKTRSNNDTFKPEYIIPQLLLQYVTSEKEKIDGIMYPSTKVNYEITQGLSLYNYVFPVKNIQSEGYCNRLTSVFKLTQPTSTDLESLASFGNLRPFTQAEFDEMDNKPQKLSIVTEEPKDYLMTQFGFLERILRTRQASEI